MNNSSIETTMNSSFFGTIQTQLTSGDNVFWLLIAFLMTFALCLLLVLKASLKHGNNADKQGKQGRKLDNEFQVDRRRPSHVVSQIEDKVV